jgi:hypothetical protein
MKLLQLKGKAIQSNKYKSDEAKFHLFCMLINILFIQSFYAYVKLETILKFITKAMYRTYFTRIV